MYILMFVLPKMILIFILFSEIIFNPEIYFFYKRLYLLLLPLIFNSILYMIYHHVTAVLDY